MPPLSKFNPSYQASQSQDNTRNSYDSTTSRSSQDSHISSMSTASEDFADHPQHNEHTNFPSSTSAHKRNTSTVSNMSSSSNGNAPNHNKALPPSPRPAPRSGRRSVAFAEKEEKPLPETPKHPHLSKLTKRRQVKRTSSRNGGYVWYAKNCQKIHNQCEADGVCDLDRSNEDLKH